MSAASVNHPVFARVYDRMTGSMEKQLGAHRDELLAGVTGRVLEVGAGNGVNFRHYSAEGIEEIVALEPEAYLRERAEEAAAQAAPLPVTVLDATADPLPFGEAEFDIAVASLVLCTVPDAARALAELRRVLRPGGELRFIEHVRAEGGRKARIQRRLDRSGIWPRLSGGCNCSRDTVGAIAAAGFELERVHELPVAPTWSHTTPVVLGFARAPA